MKVKFISIVITLIITIMSAGSLFAFDGERQGFIVGGGLGFGPVAQNELKGLPDTRFTSTGIALNLMIGYGLNDNTLLLLMRDGIIAKTETVLSEKETIFQGFTGLGILYYFGEIGESVFMTSGMGVQTFGSHGDPEISHDSEFGFLVGGGYEFSDHLQFYISFSSGETKSTFNWRHTQLLATLTFVGY